MFRRVFIISLLLVNHCWAELSDAKIKVFGGITPGVQVLENGKEAGPAIPVIEQLLQASDIDFEFHVNNWAQTHKQFARAKQSLIFALAHNSARQQQFQWIVPLAQIDLKLARSKYQPHLNPQHFDDLKNYKLAVVRGAATEEFLKYSGFVEGKDYGAVATAEQLLKYMQSGFVEFVFYETTISPMMLALFDLSPDYLVPIDVIVPEHDAIWLAASLDFPSKAVNKIRESHQRLLSDRNYQAALLKLLPKSRKNPAFDLSGQSYY